MKQKLLTKLLLMLLCLIGGASFSPAWATSYVSYNGNTKDTSTTISSNNVSSGTAGKISWTGTSCTYSSSRVNIAANGSITFTASSGYNITKIVIVSGSSSSYYGTWTSSPSVTPTSSSGTTTFDGLNANSVTVTTSTAFRCTSASSISIYYTSASVPITSISMASTASIEVGGTTTLTPTVLPANTTETVTWESDDTDVATVSAGVVTGVAAGTATITAKSPSDATIKAECTVTVNAPTTVATPTFSVAAGTFSEEQSVELSCATGEATIRYTTNGDTPTSSSTIYSSAISVDQSMTIKAKAFKDGLTDSDIASATYTLKCVAPTFSPGSSTLSYGSEITLSSTTGGSTIYYTTNGNVPTTSSAAYDSSNKPTINASQTFKAIAAKSGWSDSDVSSASYIANYTITGVSNDEDKGTVTASTTTTSNTTITATPKSGYRVIAGDGGYSVTSGSATVVNNGDNTFTVTPTTNCTIQINFEAIPSYAVTINSVTGGTLTVMNGEDEVSSGDEILDGTELTITATPDGSHNFKNWQAIDASTHTYTASNTGTYTINGRGVTFNANFTAKVYHNAIFKITGGSTYDTRTTEEGQPIDFAFDSDPEDSEGHVFVGWVAEEIDGTTDSEPTFVTSANMGNADVTYYACYAYCTPGSQSSVTDKLYTSTFGSPGSYKEWTAKQAISGSDAVYAGQSSGGTNYIQIRATSPSGIVTTTSGGKVAKVTLTWNSSTSSGRIVDIYGKNVAYAASTELYDEDDRGTKLGSISCGKSTELSISGDYSYIGLRSNSGAIYLDEIDIQWTNGTPDTYSGYCTTVPADTRTAVNIESFTATNTTLVIGGSPNTTATTVTNDQDGWTESYIYTSDNTSVATVSDEGVITAVAKGTANITVTLDIPKTGGDYKKGSTSSKSIEITVTKPFHTVTFMANGSTVSSTSVEEDDEIDIPDNPADVGNFSFQGWKASSAIDDTQSSAPTYATISTMGDADVTYYAVYAVEKDVTATFDASDISNLTNTATRTWRHNTTGLVLFLSAGQHYTSGTPNTFTVTAGTSNYFSITTPTGGVINQIVTEISATNYKINSVTAGSLSTSGTTQTVTFTNAVNTVNCKATSGNQIRAVTIDVDATLYESFCTTIPAYSVTVGDAGYTTYVAANNVSFPVGATAYIATAVNTNTIHLEEVLAVPTGEAVVVKAAAGTYNLTVEASGDCDDVSENLLLASDGTVTGGTGIYALAKKSDVVGFYPVDSKVTIPAGKAYLDLGDSDVKAFTFEFEDDADGIKTLSNSPLKGENIYNLAGLMVNGKSVNGKLPRGIYIVNGKKIAIK